MAEYNHLKIEKKWQAEWAKKKVYKTQNNSKKKKYYVLDMFPYPSGTGLHVGHPKGYIGSDVFARFKRMQGFNVLHPMGYDAFGLPAEQYAIQNNIHPRKAVLENVKTFEKQLSQIGFSYDWERKVNTTDPEFYRWTQWIFLKLYESWYNTAKNKAEPIEILVKKFQKSGSVGVTAHTTNKTDFSAGEWKAMSEKEKQDILMKYRLAFEGYSEVNWCPEMGTVLANDEVVDGPNGPVSERGGFAVVKKEMRQWFLRITAYADRLLNGLETVDFPLHIKEIERNWIGRKTGVNISYEIEKTDQSVTCFTTRPDTNFGATFIVVGPEHPLIADRATLGLSADVWKKVEEYKKNVASQSVEDRTKDGRKKTGVFLGLNCINPLNYYRMPLYVSDYVLGNVGTGAVICVPGHDVRDFEFAQAFGIPVVRVVQRDANDTGPITTIEQVQEEEGKMVNSGFLNGLDIHEATEVISDHMVKKGYATRVVNFKMRDAIFARQRYWGEPIPLMHDKAGMIQPLRDKDLPLKLPDVKSYQPTGTGESPLAGVPAWVKKGYETNTMPGWAGSSWYFLRYMDPRNKKAFADKKAIQYWKNVDMYVGGQEHATGHILYARFWHKFLKDYGLVTSEEPFVKWKSQGMILGEDNRKMSKRWGNVVNPDDVVQTYGADTLRVYEMFMGPFEASLPWSTENIIGSRRFIERVWKVSGKVSPKAKSEAGLETTLHKTIEKVTGDIETFSFNTAISSMMILVNEMEKMESIRQSDFELFLRILSPFAPHIAEEIWRTMGHKTFLVAEKWPQADKKKMKESRVTIVIQINGKVRAEHVVDTDAPEATVVEEAKLLPAVDKWLLGREIRKVVYVPNRLVNFVVA